MRPDLVLDEDDKKKRFKKFKTEDQSSGQNNNTKEEKQIASLAGKKRKKNEFPSNKISKKSAVFAFSEEDNHDISSDEDTIEREGEDFLEFVRETAAVHNVDKLYSELEENESSIDPETGLLITSGDYCYKHFPF